MREGVHQLGELGTALPQGISYRSPWLPGRIDRVLLKDGLEHRLHGRALLRGKVSHGDAHPMHPTVLEQSVEDAVGCGLQSLVILGNYQFRAAVGELSLDKADVDRSLRGAT